MATNRVVDKDSLEVTAGTPSSIVDRAQWGSHRGARRSAVLHASCCLWVTSKNMLA
jgi:hypothetical protein